MNTRPSFFRYHSEIVPHLGNVLGEIIQETFHLFGRLTREGESLIGEVIVDGSLHPCCQCINLRGLFRSGIHHHHLQGQGGDIEEHHLLARNRMLRVEGLSTDIETDAAAADILLAEGLQQFLIQWMALMEERLGQSLRSFVDGLILRNGRV